MRNDIRKARISDGKSEFHAGKQFVLNSLCYVIPLLTPIM